jgi:adenine-specific DNA-methyltransferase
MARKSKQKKQVEALTHEEARRRNIPTAEYQSVMRKEEQIPKKVSYPRGARGLEEEKARRNRDLDPQLVWRGKDEQDWSDLVVHAPPLYIQEKVHPKILIDDLLRESSHPSPSGSEGEQIDLFADFNGLPDEAARTEFYQHDANWTNRMILGDSLQVMASLAEREGLRGKVQCIYLDPPYGIKFNSNFQWSTTSNVVRDGRRDHITREPEQVKAFRDTWREGVHSYLTYLRDRLTVCRDLLSDSGSIFLQIGDENAHRVRALLDEIFGDDNFIANIQFRTKIPLGTTYLAGVADYLLWYAKDKTCTKYRKLLFPRASGDGTQFTTIRSRDGMIRRMNEGEGSGELRIPDGESACRGLDLVSAGRTESCVFDAEFNGRIFRTASKKSWKTNLSGFERCKKANRILGGKKSLSYLFLHEDYPVQEFSNMWIDTQGASGKTYVVQTSEKVIQRCILMSTDPGDLVLDPTCGAGTTAYVAEQWGRRWITIDTSRVALALARARIMGARYPYYLLADSPKGQRKEAEIARTAPSNQPTHCDIRHGFVYERVPHITLKSIANNAEIDVIWQEFEDKLEPLREQITATIPGGWLAEYRRKQKYAVEVPDTSQEWEIPRDFPEDWPEAARPLHEQFWALRIARQKEIEASIAAKADFEYLYDKPYEDKGVVRVAGPFTVESLSPHRVLGVDENDELIDGTQEARSTYGEEVGFVEMILDNLRTAGVQQAHKEDKINFTSLTPWPGELICAEGRYIECGVDGDESALGPEKRAAIFIGPEFGTVTRPDLVAAAREAGDADFDVLIACAFNYDAHSSEFDKLGRIPVLKARMNADLHMAGDLKNTGKGNLFVIFGEPDIDLIETGDGQIQVKVSGVDVFHPQTGEVRSDGPEGIACWFIDTDYNEESFFVRHAYFLGANDPYKALKTTLKAEINADAWATLHSDTSRPFPKPKSGHIAVKVINHLGDEVMKVFRV